MLSIAWIIGGRHVPNIDELPLFLRFAAWALFQSGVLWVLYVALEPLVRRRWPQTIVAWSRLLSTGPRDPLVGRDVLVGCVMGAVIGMVSRLIIVSASLLGVAPSPLPFISEPRLLLGTRKVIAETVSSLSDTVTFALGFLLLAFLLRMLLRKEWAVAAALVVVFGLGPVLQSDLRMLAAVRMILVFGGLAFVLIRFGLVAAIAAFYFDFLIELFPFTTDASAWYFGVGLFSVALMAAIAIAAFRISLGARPAFSGVRVDG